jgi:MFS family permease
MLRMRSVAGANAAGFLLGGSFFAFVFIGTLYMQQVLGYSALQTGVTWLATSLTSVALAGLSQWLVGRIGPAPILAAGMAMITGGTLWAAQVGVHGRFWADLAGPLFVAGAGTAFAFIPISIAGLAGVQERDAGLASGLLNTAQQLGGAIGVAVTSTVAASRAGKLAAAGGLPGQALTGGFQWAFLVCAAVAAAGISIGGLVIPRRLPAPPTPTADAAAMETVTAQG